jgi:hypothetical protein
VPIREPFTKPLTPDSLVGIFLKSLRPSLTVATNFLGLPRSEKEKKSFTIFLFKDPKK